MKMIILGGVATVALLFAGSVPASAGEYTGNGGTAGGGDHAASECAFSGQDAPDTVENNPPGFDDDAISFHNPGNGRVRGHGVQNYGQFVAHGMKAVVPSPGMACRGSAPQQ